MSLRRHVNTGFVFTSCRHATWDTEFPGLSVYATMRRFLSSDRRRRTRCRNASAQHHCRHGRHSP